MSSPPDGVLIANLLRECGPRLALYAAQWTLVPEDCVQQALVELARQRETPANPTAWLYRVVKRFALNAARSERRRQQRETASVRRRLPPAAEEQTRELLDLLDQLPPDDRELVVLKIWGNLTLAEIAELLNLSLSTVHRRYTNAIAQLRTTLTESPEL
jgi:RNA polymerase sigma-70 factor (ECF subfamily)